MKYLKTFSKIVFIFATLLLVLVAVFYNYQRYVTVKNFEDKIADWKKAEWLTIQDGGLVSKAIVAAEDPNFFTNPGLKCGVFDLISGAVFGADMDSCSRVIVHAGKLVSERTGSTLLFVLQSNFITDRLSEEPYLALEIILNKAFFGEVDSRKFIGYSAIANHFRLDPKRVDVFSAVFFAAILPAPSRYLKGKDLDQLNKRRLEILATMLSSGLITQEEADQYRPGVMEVGNE